MLVRRSQPFAWLASCLVWWPSVCPIIVVRVIHLRLDVNGWWLWSYILITSLRRIILWFNHMMHTCILIVQPCIRLCNHKSWHWCPQFQDTRYGTIIVARVRSHIKDVETDRWGTSQTEEEVHELESHLSFSTSMPYLVLRISICSRFSSLFIFLNACGEGGERNVETVKSL